MLHEVGGRGGDYLFSGFGEMKASKYFLTCIIFEYREQIGLWVGLQLINFAREGILNGWVVGWLGWLGYGMVGCMKYY